MNEVTVTLPLHEYERLKREAELPWEIRNVSVRSLMDGLYRELTEDQEWRGLNNNDFKVIFAIRKASGREVKGIVIGGGA